MREPCMSDPCGASPVYGEATPASPLRPWVECYWWTRGRTASAVRHRVLPDGCMDVIFDAVGASGPSVVGTMTRPLEVRRDGVVDTLGIRFRPGGLPRFVPLLARELLDGAVALDAVLGPRHRLRGLGDLLTAASPSHRASLLDAALVRCLGDGLAGDGLAARAAALLESAPDVAQVCRRLGVSRRTLERRFDEAVGVSPAVLRRILRFRAAADLTLTRPDLPLAAVAARTGFADQPHMTREVVAWAGRPPGLLRLERHP